MLNVHMLEDFDDSTLMALKAQLDPRIHVATGSIISPDTHILVGGRPAREQLAASPALRAVIVPWAGVPEDTRELLRTFPRVTLHNLHHNAAATAETALACCYLPPDSLCRSIDSRERTIGRRAMPPRDRSACMIKRR
jgi:hypothetical protein